MNLSELTHPLVQHKYEVNINLSLLVKNHTRAENSKNEAIINACLRIATKILAIYCQVS